MRTRESCEPRASQSRHLLERIGLFKQMRGSGDNDELLFAAQLRERRLIQLDDREVVSSHDQQGGGLDARQSLPAKSGRPPRETTATASSGRSAAATSAAAAPVLAPK